LKVYGADNWVYTEFAGMKLWQFLPFATLLLYFALLILIARLTSQKGGAKMNDFFLAGKKTPWLLVAWGMLGNSLSGVTFISVPGMVGKSGMEYFQVVIAFVLLPLYYKMNLTTIYEYLESRIGKRAYKTGAVFFILSRLLGTAARLLLVAGVLQEFIFSEWGIPFEITVAGTIALILFYTIDGGMKTLVWTDALQSTCLVGAVVLTLYLIPGESWLIAKEDHYTRVFNFNPTEASFFLKHFLGGAFIAIVMTGLDQDQMQKNLICKDIGSAQKNMVTFSLAMAVVNFCFLFLGVVLFRYCDLNHLSIPEKSDHLYPWLALDLLGKEIPALMILFLLGLTASAYSSADGALTALTTSFSIDLLDIREDNPRNLKTRKVIHVGMAIVLFLAILVLNELASRQTPGSDNSIISWVLKIATFTYGPLLGMFAFGILTTRKTRDKWVPLFSILPPLLCLLLYTQQDRLFESYKFGNELLLLNGLISFMLLFSFSTKNQPTIQT
jgi:Na+/proline symporter